MNDKDDLVFIKHVLESIVAIEDFTKNIQKRALFSDRLRRSAIVREIEIIGEAVKNISNPTKEKYSEVEWKKIIGTRDKMIHNYFGVDLNIVWYIVKKDVPILKKQIQKIKKDLESAQS